MRVLRKRVVITAFLIAILLFTLMPARPAYAAKGQSNMNLEVSSVQIQPGWSITVAVNNDPMTVSTFTGGFAFDPAVYQVESITVNNTGIGIVSEKEEANANGTVGFAAIGVNDKKYDAGTLLTVELKAVNEGYCELTLYEDSDGADGFTGGGIGVIATQVTWAADGTAEGSVAGPATYISNVSNASAGNNNTGEGEKKEADGKSVNGKDDSKNKSDTSGKNEKSGEKGNSKRSSDGKAVIWPYIVGSGILIVAVAAVFIILSRMRKKK